MSQYFVAGGAGFIGSHLVSRLLESEDCFVIVYDNFSSGRMWHLADFHDNDRLQIVQGDIKDLDKLTDAMKGSNVVFHFASNPDISKALTQPNIDFWEGTYLTQNILDAMRINDVKRILYSSGSGIYGDTGETPVFEDYAPLLPISTYGASKLACEALICAFCHMFDISGAAFRFANVVGPHQTHGVCYDFIRILLQNPSRLPILGDGSQSKSYIYVDDVVAAMCLIAAQTWTGFCYYNVATSDYVTVREIAAMVVEDMGLDDVNYQFSGGSRGWKGDVPIVRFNTEKIRQLGWQNNYSSREALHKSIRSMIEDTKSNRFGWE